MPSPFDKIANGYDDALKQVNQKPIDMQATLRSAANLPTPSPDQRSPASGGSPANLSHDEQAEMISLMKGGNSLVEHPRLKELHMKYMGQ